jgi:hypothetical protein
MAPALAAINPRLDFTSAFVITFVSALAADSINCFSSCDTTA